MPIRVSCPECGTAYSLNESLCGKKIRCRKCEGVIAVEPALRDPAEAFSEIPLTRAPVRKPAPAQEKSGGVSRALLWGSVAAVVLGVAAVGVAIVLVLNLAGSNEPVARGTPPTPPAPPPPAATGKDSPQPADTGKEDRGSRIEDRGSTTATPNPQSASGTGRPVSGSGQQVYQHLLQSVVWIVARVPDGITSGSGSLIDKPNRLILSNYHVIHRGTDFKVFFPMHRDGKLVAERDVYLQSVKESGARVSSARVLASDRVRDLALLQLDRLPGDLEPLAVARTSTAPGETVHSVGNPGGSGGLWVYTSGTVRQVYRKKWRATGTGITLDLEAQVVETQSPTNPGDSGGPLVNDRGELVGVTQGGDFGKQLLSTFIDQSEVNDFVSKHFASAGGEWMRSERLLAAADVDPSRIPALVAKLADPQATVRAEGAQGLGSLGPAARIARPELMKALKDSDGLVQRLALEALKHIGPPAKSDVAMLSGAMEEAGPQVQLYVLGALAVLGPEAREALPAVLQRVENPDTAVREQAIRTAGKVAAGDRDRLLPVLEKALKDGHKPVRVAAAEVLTRDVKLSGPDVPRLQELLKHEDGEVRLHGVRGLARIGPAAKEAGKPLAALLREKDPPLRRASLEALMAVGMEPRSAVPELQKLLADTDPEMRRLAIVAVGKLGASGKEAAPALVKLLDDKELRSPALDALAAVGPGAARDAAGPVARLIAEKDLRSRALATLAALKPAGNDAQPAIPKLIEMFEQERSVELRDTAAGILGQMGRTAVPALVRALSHTNPLVRVGAAASLGKAGPQARTAIAALQKAAQTDSITEVRDEATNALARILQK